MKKTLLVLVIAFSLVGTLWASGFQINEHGAKAMAMSGAFTAIANDASAVYFNPAGMTQLDGTQIMGGLTIIAPASKFRGVSPEITEYEIESKLFTPINVYATHKINDDWAVGLGVNNPFGLGTLWPKDWVGKYIAVDTEVRTFFFAGNVAYKISEQLSIAAGVNFVYGDVKIERFNSLAPFEGSTYIQLEGDGTAWGFNAALLYKPAKKLSVGVSFRSETKLDFKGESSNDASEIVAANVPSGKINATLKTPMNLTFGLGYFPTDEWTVSADFQYIGWSSYDKLEVTFEESGVVSSSARDYQNSWIARLGAEYNFCDPFVLRGGLLYDSNPVKDELVEPTLPDADRIGFNVGFGYDVTETFVIDVAYLFLRFTEREITNSEVSYTDGFAAFNGVYNSTAHLFGIDFTYKF